MSRVRFTIAALCLGLIVSYIFIGVLFFQPPVIFNLDQRLCGVSWQNWLGCDQNGNDIMTLLAYGGGVSLLVSLISVFLSVVLGSFLGLISGYFGGRVDQFLMRLLDVFLAFPGILLAIFLSSALGPSYFNIILAISLTGWMGVARLIRGEVLSLKVREHVLAAKMIGASHWRILLSHIYPLIIPVLVVHTSFSISGAIIIESSLSFLGLGPQGALQSWGATLSQGKDLLVEVPQIAIAPGILITIVVLSLNLIGDSLRDFLDPLRCKK